MKKVSMGDILVGQKGATLILIALCLPVFLGVAALALDIGHLVVTKNELQNAADAGALAGAREIYIVNNDGTIAPNPKCKEVAITASSLNKSDKLLLDSEVAEITAIRGHWRLSTRTFDDTNKDSYTVPKLYGVTEKELDDDITFINAVKVVVNREPTPIVAWFAGLLGHPNFTQSGEAIAYVGYAGKIATFKADAPIAICNTALGNPMTCKWGRLINDGKNPLTSESGGWTDLTQPEPCNSGTNDSAIRSVVSNMSCKQPPDEGANNNIIEINKPLAMINGQANDSFKDFEACWNTATSKSKEWDLVLPVINCQNGFDPNCNIVVGAVKVRVVWVTVKDDSNNYSDLPTSMTSSLGTWTPPAIPKGTEKKDVGPIIWNDFAQFHTLTQDGTKNTPSLPYQGKTVYFLPACEEVVPMGTTGGQNFGILAKDPVLVK